MRYLKCCAARENERRRTAAIVLQSVFRQISSARNVIATKEAVYTLQAYTFMFLHHTKVKAARRLQHWIRRHLGDNAITTNTTTSSIRRKARNDFDSRRDLALNHLRERRIELGLEKKSSGNKEELQSLLDRMTPELRMQIEAHITSQVQRQMAAFYKLSNRKNESNSTSTSYQISPTVKPIVSLPSRKIQNFRQ